MNQKPITDTNVSTGPVRFGLVGCGAVTRGYHLPIFAGYDQVKITAFCDQNEKAARLAQTESGQPAEVTTQVDALVGKIDAALVAVPPRFHAPVCLQLLNAGIDVLCEKPLATSLHEGQQMVDAARAHQRILAVGLQMRFHPNNALLKEIIAAGWLGELKKVVAELGAPLDWEMSGPSYYSRETTGGGVFFDMGVHLVDRVTWMFGKLHEIEYEDDSYGGVESNAALRGKLTVQGQAVDCEMAFSWTHELNNSVHVVGSDASVTLHLREPNLLILHRPLPGGHLALKAERESCAAFNPYLAQLQDFVAAVRTRRDPLVSAATTLPALETIEQAYLNRQRMAQPWVETNAA